VSTALCAAFDLGSNSVKVLIGRPTGGPVDIVEQRVAVTRLSQGVDATGRLHPDAVARTLEALREMVERCSELGVQRLTAVGTAVLRDAQDAPDFLDACRGLLGLEVEVVDDDAMLVDIGGGSTEVVWSGGAESTELGVVRLTERHVHVDPPGLETLETLRRVVAKRLDALPVPPDVSAVVGSSASCSLLARISLKLAMHDPQRIHGHHLSLREIGRIAGVLAGQTEAERAAWPGIDARRADVLLAGAAVLEGAARRAGVEGVIVSDRGTRFGVFHRAFTQKAWSSSSS
jgi:exopolyphosphatase/guanosine-5'-triphosphate,3'-diphosphate pyrophosphatase